MNLINQLENISLPNLIQKSFSEGTDSQSWWFTHDNKLVAIGFKLDDNPNGISFNRDEYLVEKSREIFKNSNDKYPLQELYESLAFIFAINNSTIYYRPINAVFPIVTIDNALDNFLQKLKEVFPELRTVEESELAEFPKLKEKARSLEQAKVQKEQRIEELEAKLKTNEEAQKRNFEQLENERKRYSQLEKLYNNFYEKIKEVLLKELTEKQIAALKNKLENTFFYIGTSKYKNKQPVPWLEVNHYLCYPDLIIKIPLETTRIWEGYETVTLPTFCYELITTDGEVTSILSKEISKNPKAIISDLSMPHDMGHLAASLKGCVAITIEDIN